MQEIYVLLQYLAMTSLFTQINSNHSRNNIMGRGAGLQMATWSDNLPGQDNRKLLLPKQATLLNQWKNK